MIQVIGVMVGLYILTRCAELFDNPDARVIARTLAAITFLGNCLGIALLLASGTAVAVPR